MHESVPVFIPVKKNSYVKDPDGIFSSIPSFIKPGLKTGWTINVFWRFKNPNKGVEVGILGLWKVTVRIKIYVVPVNSPTNSL